MSSAPNERRLRLRAVLDAQATAILVVCLLLAATGAGLVYTTHVDPGTTEESRTVSSLTVESEYVHSATVTEPNAVFETGAVLDGRDTYFTRIAPELDVNVTTSYAASSAEDVTVGVGSTLVIRNVGEGGTVFWSETESLASETVSGVAPGETVNASFTLNSTAIDGRVASIEDQLGASPGETETFVTTEVVVDGSIDGVPTASTQTLDMTLTHGGATYSVSEPGVQSDTASRTEQVTVERDYGALRSFGGPLLLLVGLVGAGGIGYGTREFDLALTPAEREYLSYRDDRSEFDEWITTFRLPPSVHERPTAEAGSLRDLVDFAIDNDTGVVEDPGTGAFHAVSGEFVYTYRPPAPTGLGDEFEGEPAGVEGESAGVEGESDGVEIERESNPADTGEFGAETDGFAPSQIGSGDTEPTDDTGPADDAGSTDDGSIVNRVRDAISSDSDGSDAPAEPDRDDGSDPDVGDEEDDSR